jgi:FkbM family methyltransferase
MIRYCNRLVAMAIRDIAYNYYRRGSSGPMRRGSGLVMAAQIGKTGAMSPPDSAPLGALQQELLRKGELEAALIAAPRDEHLRGEYFDELLRFASNRTGLTHVLLPELGHPLTLRCGTWDIISLLRAFRDRAYDVPLRSTPRRILILGAYVGYSAVALAHRFPAARIAAVEPCADSFRVLGMNTLPLRRIQGLNLAAWHSATRLGVLARNLGDWGTLLHDQLSDTERNVAARPVDEVLRMAGWDQVDLVVCDLLGAEAAVLANPAQGWLRTLDALVVAVPEERRAALREQLAGGLPPDAYTCEQRGELLALERRHPFHVIARPRPREMPLISCEPGLFPIRLQDTQPTQWGFFVFDGDSCQLHPNAPGEAPARAVFPRTLEGHSRFSATLSHAGRPAAPVEFTFLVIGEDGGEVFRAGRTLNGGEQQALELDLPTLEGRHLLILQTEMAAGAPNNHSAWAQWRAPRIG